MRSTTTISKINVLIFDNAAGEFPSDTGSHKAISVFDISLADALLEQIGLLGHTATISGGAIAPVMIATASDML